MFSAAKVWVRPGSMIICGHLTPLDATGPALPVETLSGWRLIFNRLKQSFRLMVGVRDYPTYLRHMRLHHPDKTPMTARQFHRYCLNARYPDKPGSPGRCPC